MIECLERGQWLWLLVPMGYIPLNLNVLPFYLICWGQCLGTMSVISSFLNWPLVEDCQRGAGKSNFKNKDKHILERIKVHWLFESWTSAILDIGGSRLFMLTPLRSLLFSVLNSHRSIAAMPTDCVFAKLEYCLVTPNKLFICSFCGFTSRMCVAGESWSWETVKLSTSICQRFQRHASPL